MSCKGCGQKLSWPTLSPISAVFVVGLRKTSKYITEDIRTALGLKPRDIVCIVWHIPAVSKWQPLSISLGPEVSWTRDTRNRTGDFPLSVSRASFADLPVQAAWFRAVMTKLCICHTSRVYSWPLVCIGRRWHHHQQSVIYSLLNLRHIRLAYVRLTGIRESFLFVCVLPQKLCWG
jgi:hypothetical protein